MKTGSLEIMNGWRMKSNKISDRSRKFKEHFFAMLTYSESNEGVIEKLKKYEPYEQDLERHYTLANIPEKYFDFEFENIKTKILTIEQNIEQINKVEKYLSSLDKAAEKGIGLYLSGPHGVAKTTISVIVLKEAIHLRHKCFFCKASSIVDFVRSGWKNEDKKKFWEYVINAVDFLVIDDMVRSYNQINEAEKIYIDGIFTKRDDANLSTIITANHKLESNRELFGEALFSNFKERLIEVNLIGDDFRNIIWYKLLEDLD